MGLNKKFQIIVNAMLVILAVLMMGCANYQFGDFSKAYCSSTNQEFRAYAKARLTENGVKVDVNYCIVHGFVDAVGGG